MKKSTLFVTYLLSVSSLLSQDRITGLPWATRSEVIAQNGMACTSQPLCTQIALDILKAGGNAMDAAIAANACLGLMEPTGSGIGGDLFAIIWDGKTQQLYGLNSSGPSPKGLTLSYFKEKNIESIPAYGALPVSVPGAVSGWFAIHKKFGSMGMDKLLQPAIDYAENGFPVSELIAYYISLSVPRFAERFPNIKDTWTINGQVPGKGDVFKNPNLANTYRKIAKGGRDVFYKGEIAQTVAKFI
jgi:gamma-glutamyltranspeptidase/glutathione hydrolase